VRARAVGAARVRPGRGGGLALAFPGGRAAGGRPSVWGAWLTPAYLGERFSQVGVVRVRADGRGTDSAATRVEVGGRTVYAFQRFAASAEAVVRAGGDRPRRARLTAVVDARVTEETWLTLTFGRDFDPRRANSLLAHLGFSWQIGDRTVRPD
jgi:hypothetical protein